MRILIASDIHGSAYYCDLLMRRIEEENPERIFLLGDHLYHGPRNDLPREYDPKRVLASLNEYAHMITSVRGNCDSEVDQMVLDFPTMDDYRFVETDDIPMYLSHGHVYNKEKPIEGMKGVFLYGHTHVPDLDEREDIVFINPGSVSIPKQESDHSYMMYEDGTFSWKKVEDGTVYKTYEYDKRG